MTYDSEYYYAVQSFLEDDEHSKIFNIIEKSIDYQDSEILNEWDDLIDVHPVLEEINVN